MAATCSTGKTFNLSTTLDHNPFMVATLADGRVPQSEPIAFSKEVMFDPVLGRELFVQQTPMGPIATVPTILPSQLDVVNVTDGYNAVVKKLINHVPTSSAILRDTHVFARYDKDGLYYPAKVQEHVEGNTFVIEFDSNYVSGLRMQSTGSFDMIAREDAMRHSVGEGDFCLAPIDEGFAPFAPGKILFDDNTPDNQFKIQLWHGPVKQVALEDVCWIPSVLYDRIISELKSPEARMQTISMAQGQSKENHPLDLFLNCTPKYMLQSGMYLPATVMTRAWMPFPYQGYRYIPTYPVPWFPSFWPNDINIWPKYLLPFRRTFAAIETNERLPGIHFSVNELDAKVGGTIDKSKKVLETTSGSYLERMESFLSKHDNMTLEELTKDVRDPYDDYECNIDWRIPHKETCDVGENTVVSVHNILRKSLKKEKSSLETRPPWKKYVKSDDPKHTTSVIHSGKYNEIENIHGYTDDDYTIWRLKEKQYKTLEQLHERKAKFLISEACRMKEREESLLTKIDNLHKKVETAEKMVGQ